jgi:dienelactone hydrolase
MKTPLFSLLVLALPLSFSFAQELPRGKVLEKVICRADSSQSYALYLPSQYTPEKKWPILYAFDAGARGALPVQRFSEAAERFGYILAGSNNSRNGPNDPILKAIRALLEDTQSRFSIDDRRFYLAGFSGGARVAISVAFGLKHSVAGVIACGAGFPPEITPSSSVPFALFGTVGTDDFNFPEMRHLDQALDRFAVPHRIEVFEGDHDWLPSSLCVQAIEWMELQAMKSGRKTKNEPFVEESFQRAIQRLRAAEDAKQWLAAYDESVALVRDFKGLRDVAGFEQKAEALRNSNHGKEALKQEKELEEKQNLITARFFQIKNNVKDPERDSSEMRDLRDAIRDLKKKSDLARDLPDRRMARRALTLVFVQLTQEASQQFEIKRYDISALDLLLGTMIRPDNPALFYDLACVYAVDGKKREAILMLKNAVDKGFADVKALESDSHLDPVRKEADFQRLLEDLKKKTKP